MASDGAWHRVVEGRPAAARFELMICSVKWSIAARACVKTRCGHMLVVLPSVGSFGAFLAEDAKLL